MYLVTRSLIVLLIFGFIAFYGSMSSAQKVCEDYWTAEYKCMEGCGPCPNTGNTNKNSQPATAAPDPAIARAEHQAWILNNQGIEAYYNNQFEIAVQLFEQSLQLSPNDGNVQDNLQKAKDQIALREKRKQEEFERNKVNALNELKGVSVSNDSDSGLKGVDSSSSGLKPLPEFNTTTITNANAAHQYVFAGNGLIGGTTWTLYASRKPGEPEKRMCEVIKQQAKLAGANYDAGIDCVHYQFVIGIASSIDPFTDLNNRVAMDDLTNGQFSAHEQALYDKLRGKQFHELGCHSNGAMICLAALENQDIQAENVVLYGPQVTRESLAMWNKLIQDGRIKSVKVYLNENDPVPGASISYADLKNKDLINSAHEPALFQIDSLKRTINELSPRIAVQTFPCKLDRASLGCHAMTMYKAKVNCTGKSSSQTVAGTALHGKDDLPEPPLPCDALGINP